MRTLIYIGFLLLVLIITCWVWIPLAVGVGSYRVAVWARKALWDLVVAWGIAHQHKRLASKCAKSQSTPPIQRGWRFAGAEIAGDIAAIKQAADEMKRL